MSNIKLPPSPIIVITHNIFLTREQRYQVVDKQTVEVVGVSLPVWLSKEHSSLPAEEVFCKYVITNNPDEPQLVESIGGGYRVNLPQTPKDWQPQPPLSDEQWRSMDEKSLSTWYKNNTAPKNADCLRDLKDGGNEYLKFKYLGEFTDNGKQIHLMHYCNIKTIEALEQSIV